MKYYLIAGEASGDLHASRLMRSLRQKDPQAEFRFFGGDLMTAEGGTLVKHYREMAYMGFVPVLLHLPTILRNMKLCKRDITDWQPDAVILVDYPGFNLDIAKFVHRQQKEANGRRPQVYYYIAPKIWAWKEYRIKRIKRDVDELYSILPFETDFFERKHHYPIHYVGNPTAQEVREFLDDSSAADADFYSRNHLSAHRPVIALLCGSRRQEIKDNLPVMLQATDTLADRYQIVVAGAPAIAHDYYARFTRGHRATVLQAGQTYQLLHRATAALVTSGTATLETCLLGVPQVVCYYTPLKHFIGMMKRMVLSVKYVSLVNLIANRQVVTELVADSFSVANVRRELDSILPDGRRRQAVLDGYREVATLLGSSNAPEAAATLMVNQLEAGRE